MSAGKDFGLTNAGHYAINSLRLEKAYRAWGSDISPDDSPVEAGLTFAIDWNKRFLGRDALLQKRAKAPKRLLVTFVLENPEPMLWGNEPIYRDNRPVGYTTSGSYGHSVGAAIGMGYVNHPDGIDPQFIQRGKFEINISGERFAVKPYLRPPYDPGRKKILQ